MIKRIFSIVLIISFLAVGFCFAFDGSSIKDLWDGWIPKISEYWNSFLSWIDSGLKPWIEENIGIKTRQEFERELDEAIKEVPETAKFIWSKIRDILN